ncbi:MAG: aldo/keto reductase, partial [Bryocella sp.]
DYVDLLQVHDVEFGDVEQIIQETIPAMRRLQEQGKVRYIGVTGYPLKPLIRIAEATPVDCILSYCRHTLLTDDMDSILLPVAEKLGIGVINASPLLMGVLTNHSAPTWHPASKEVRAAAHEAAKFCSDHGEDLAEVALRFCLQSTRVASTLVGMSTTEQVRKNLHTLLTPVDEQIMNRVSAILAPVYNKTWASGRQENQD